MAVVRKIRNRGATITVEANAEILFMPGGKVNDWANRFTGRIRAATIAAAPLNKRPRWGHYGAPLKSTSGIVSARPRFWSNGGDRQRVYAAVGSTRPYAYYVDQGTGIYNGSGPYAAKVIPPWAPVIDLYEHTWSPKGPGGRTVAPVMIRGQKGQKFFEKGLAAAFQSMRMRAYQVPGDPRIGAVLNAVPTGLDNFKGNTPNDAAFQASLEQWRADRDKRWSREGSLGPKKGGTKKRPRGSTPKAPKTTKAKTTKPKKAKELPSNFKAKVAAQVGAALRKQGAQVRGLVIRGDGTWTALVKRRGRTIFKVTKGRWRD